MPAFVRGELVARAAAAAWAAMGLLIAGALSQLAPRGLANPVR